MTTPVRLRLSRRKGFNLQAASIALNGLPAVNVARPSKWGNPYREAPAFSEGGVTVPEFTIEACVDAYRDRIQAAARQWQSTRAALRDLRGRNLACWCRPGEPCHADVLLELANRPVCEEVPAGGDSVRDEG